MVKVQSVLFATDFSEDSDYALPYARAMAELFNAKLYVLHVVENPLDSLYGEPHGEYPALEANARKKAHELMAKYDGELRDFPNNEFLIKVGDPAVEIVATAEEKQAGTIVMGSHGGGALRHLLLGSNCEKVIKSADCPIYIVRHPSRRRP